jgi:hypothetical protein
VDIQRGGGLGAARGGYVSRMKPVRFVLWVRRCHVMGGDDKGDFECRKWPLCRSLETEIVISQRERHHYLMRRHG